MCFCLINLKAINLKWDLIDHDFSTFIKRMHCCRGSDHPSPGRRQFGLPSWNSKGQRNSINTMTSIPWLLHLSNLEKALGLLILYCRPHLTLNVTESSQTQSPPKEKAEARPCRWEWRNLALGCVLKRPEPPRLTGGRSLTFSSSLQEETKPLFVRRRERVNSSFS